MKVETEKTFTGFQPYRLTITVENEYESDALAHLCDQCAILTACSMPDQVMDIQRQILQAVIEARGR